MLKSLIRTASPIAIAAAIASSALGADAKADNAHNASSDTALNNRADATMTAESQKTAPKLNSPKLNLRAITAKAQLFSNLMHEDDKGINEIHWANVGPVDGEAGKKGADTHTNYAFKSLERAFPELTDTTPEAVAAFADQFIQKNPEKAQKLLDLMNTGGNFMYASKNADVQAGMAQLKAALEKAVAPTIDPFADDHLIQPIAPAAAAPAPAAPVAPQPAIVENKAPEAAPVAEAPQLEAAKESRFSRIISTVKNNLVAATQYVSNNVTKTTERIAKAKTAVTTTANRLSNGLATATNHLSKATETVAKALRNQDKKPAIDPIEAFESVDGEFPVLDLPKPVDAAPQASSTPDTAKESTPVKTVRQMKMERAQKALQKQAAKDTSYAAHPVRSETPVQMSEAERIAELNRYDDEGVLPAKKAPSQGDFSRDLTPQELAAFAYDAAYGRGAGEGGPNPAEAERFKTKHAPKAQTVTPLPQTASGNFGTVTSLDNNANTGHSLNLVLNRSLYSDPTTGSANEYSSGTLNWNFKSDSWDSSIGISADDIGGDFDYGLSNSHITYTGETGFFGLFHDRYGAMGNGRHLDNMLYGRIHGGPVNSLIANTSTGTAIAGIYGGWMWQGDRTSTALTLEAFKSVGTNGNSVLEDAGGSTDFSGFGFSWARMIQCNEHVDTVWEVAGRYIIHNGNAGYATTTQQRQFFQEWMLGDMFLPGYGPGDLISIFNGNDGTLTGYNAEETITLRVGTKAKNEAITYVRVAQERRWTGDSGLQSKWNGEAFIGYRWDAHGRGELKGEFASAKTQWSKEVTDRAAAYVGASLDYNNVYKDPRFTASIFAGITHKFSENVQGRIGFIHTEDLNGNSERKTSVNGEIRAYWGPGETPRP